MSNTSIKPPFDFALVYSSKDLNKQNIIEILSQNSFKSKFIDIQEENKTVFFIKNTNYTQLLNKAEELRLEKEFLTPVSQEIQNNEKYKRFKAVLQRLDPRVAKYEKYRKFRYDIRQGFFRLPEGINEEEEQNELIFKNIFSQSEQVLIKYSILFGIKSNIGNREVTMIEYQQDEHKLREVVPLHDDEASVKVYSNRDIQQYFGEQVSFYFEFVRFFQKWLLIPIICGILVETLDHIYSYDDVTHSPFESIYCIFIVLWANIFYSQWKRQEYTLRHEYRSGSKNFIHSQKFHHYDQKKMQTKIDKVSGEPIQYYPKKKRFLKYLKAYILSLPIIILTIAFLIISLNIRGLIDKEHDLLIIPFFAKMGEEGGWFDPNGKMGFLPNILHVVIVAQINGIYMKLVVHSTKDECHDTEYKYQDSIINKRFIFEFFSYFTDLFYVAFINFDIVALKNSLIALYSFDEVRRLASETIIPLIRNNKLGDIKEITVGFLLRHLPFLDKQRIQRENQFKERIAILSEQDYIKLKLKEIEKPKYEQFDDYIEVIMNFGYLTLFASAFTFAPALVFIFNFIEYQSDKFKLVHNYQRPIPKKAKGIGSWNHVLNTMAIICVFTNIILFAFSSEQIVEMFPSLFEKAEQGVSFFSSLIKTVSSGAGHFGKFGDSIANQAKKFDLTNSHVLGGSNTVPVNGKARYVVALLFGIEHVLFGLIWLIRKVIRSRKHWTEIHTDRKEYMKRFF